ncbi:MAG: ABC transporter permease [Bacteroidota bacterium]
MNLKKTYTSFKLILQKNRVLRRCIRLFTFITCVAFLAPFLANDKPLICKYKGQLLFPAFSYKNHVFIDNESINYLMGKDWQTLKTEFSIFPPCSYSPNTIDADNAPRKGPFDNQIMNLKNGESIPLPIKFRHWLGTTQNGNDVLSCLIHGIKISLGVGIFSMLIAALLGITLGAAAGYFQNTGLKIGYIQMVFLIISIFFNYFLCFVIRAEKLSDGFQSGGIWLFYQIGFTLYLWIQNTIIFLWLGKWIDEKFDFNNRLHFPIDTIVLRIIEILNSIPTLLLIIALSAITKPSFSLLIVIIGFLSWTGIARITRAEYLKAKQLDYVTSCKAIGMGHYRIIARHILPNVLPLILVPVVFGLAGAVLIEASLSFIGVGVPLDVITWGSLLNEAREHFSAWWLVLFPGLCVFTLIFIYNKIAVEISKFK